MNIPLYSTAALKTTHIRHFYTYWAACLILLGSFLVADTAVVAWTAGLVNAAQIIAFSLTFALISSGVLVTVYLMEPL